jgi:hypothetical protein
MGIVGFPIGSAPGFGSTDIHARDATRDGTHLQVYILYYGTTFQYSDPSSIKSMGYAVFVVKFMGEVLKMGYVSRVRFTGTTDTGAIPT